MFERLVGLEVTDDASYDKYRQKMQPILKRYGGGFRYDFRISKVLKSDTKNEINRVFIITFPDKASGDAFFADANYLKIRKTFFEPAVRAVTLIATYERPE